MQLRISGTQGLHWHSYCDCSLCQINVLSIFTHWRSIAKRGGCFQRRLFVCQFVSVFVCLFVHTITSEQLNVGWWNLVVRCTVRKSLWSSNVKVKGQGHQGQKNENLLSHSRWQCMRCVRRRLYAASSNRRYGRHCDATASMTSHGYASGKIDACCLVTVYKRISN